MVGRVDCGFIIFFKDPFLAIVLFIFSLSLFPSSANTDGGGRPGVFGALFGMAGGVCIVVREGFFFSTFTFDDIFRVRALSASENVDVADLPMPGVFGGATFFLGLFVLGVAPFHSKSSLSSTFVSFHGLGTLISRFAVIRFSSSSS